MLIDKVKKLFIVKSLRIRVKIRDIKVLALINTRAEANLITTSIIEKASFLV